MIKFGIWFIERAIETILVSIAIMLFIDRPSQHISDSLAEEVLRTMLLPMLFYIISGYLASCIYFGLISRRNKTLTQVFVMAAAFSVHTLAFFLLTNGAFYDYIWKFYVFGLAIVVFASTVGNFLLTRIIHEEAVEVT